MNLPQAKKEIKSLTAQIEKHNYQYYTLHDPVVSDEEYDRLLEKLINLEEAFPQLKSSSSPTQRVGAKVEGSLPMVKHSSAMLSLDNTYSQQELGLWYQRLIKALKNDKPTLMAELKIDGLSCALTYTHGVLSLAATRGDGEIGEDVTRNARTIHDIPLSIKGSSALFEVRGEVYMERQDFNTLNQQRKKEGQILFANPRNAAAGSLKLLDARLCGQRHLRFFVHSPGFGQRQGPLRQSEFLKQAKDNGFVVSPYSRLCHSLDEVMVYYQEYAAKRKELAFEVDGVVVKVDDFNTQSKLGARLKSPRWAVAFKFPAHQVTTIVNDITVQVGRTGVLTPVAELEPVSCAGVLISRATLHNFDEIRRLGLGIKDRVLLERAGDVIPKIVKVVEKHSKGPWVAPADCPSCGATIQKIKEEDVAYRCLNPSCPKQLERHLVHFVSRAAMDIEGLGEKIILQLLDKGLVRDLADIYFLTKDPLLGLDLFADKKTRNLLEAIAKSKTRPFPKFLYGLGIPHIGVKAAINLARHFKSLDAIINVKTEDLTPVPEIGPVMALSVVEYFKQPQVKRLLAKFKDAHLNFTDAGASGSGTRLKAKKFLFTGELDGLTRQEAAHQAQDQGGIVSTSVSRGLDYLVVGKNPGSKLAKARSLGVKTLNQKEFEELLHGS